jgi:Txe/YoeB family toxin of Txe-Axe toxin-antitoxin module
MTIETYADNLDYQELVTAFEKAKALFKTAKADRHTDPTVSKWSKAEEKAGKRVIHLSYFQYKQAMYKQKAEKLRLKSEKLQEKAEKLAVRIAKLNLKICEDSLKKTPKTEKLKKTKGAKKKAHKNDAGNRADMLEEPTAKAKSKAASTNKTVKTHKST